jgi:hypothetical protein
MKAPRPVDFLDFLLSVVYDGMALHAEHLSDLRKSGLTDETIHQQKIRTVPPAMINALVGFDTPKVVSAYLLPYADPAGGWMQHVRMKIFPALTEEGGSTVKYLQPVGSGIRIFFPVTALAGVLRTTEPLWVVEGEKKALAVAQQGLPSIGIAGINAWTAKGTRRLHSDFDGIPLLGRPVELVPDSDWQTHPQVNRAVGALASALARRGAKVRVVVLPDAAPA